MIIVLNKCDTIPADQKEKKIERVTAGLRKALGNTKFKESQIISISANPGEGAEGQGIEDLKNALLSYLPNLEKIKDIVNPDNIESKQPFEFSIDHCFAIKGQGTIITGTILNGSVQINQTIEFPELKVQKKVKSMQMFKKPVEKAKKGDRVGICVTQLDPKLLERGIAGDPGAFIQIHGGIIHADKIKFFKTKITSKSKFHISIGHSTVMAKIQVFDYPEPELANKPSESNHFECDRDYLAQDEFLDHQFILLQFEKPVVCARNSLIIGSKLDSNINSNVCRIAFSGKLIEPIFEDCSVVENLKRFRIYRERERIGAIDRAVDECNVIGCKLFKKETNMNLFVGLNVIRSTNNAVGRIEGSFGKSGKFKVYFPAGGQSGTDGELILKFKKYVYDRSKKITQA